MEDTRENICENCGHKCHCTRECNEEYGIGMTDKYAECMCKECNCKSIREVKKRLMRYPDWG